MTAAKRRWRRRWPLERRRWNRWARVAGEGQSFFLTSSSQLLDSESFVTSLGAKSPDVLSFLKGNGNSEKLIDLVVSVESPAFPPGADPQDVPTEVQTQRRHAYVAYQALTTDAMCEVMIEDYALLDKLFSFLDHPSQNDALKNGYFSKIVLTVYEKYPAELFLYFSIKAHMVKKFCNNIKNLFVMELLFKFIDSLSSHQWLADEHLIGQLVDLLDEEKYDVETQESAVRTLEIICNICSYCLADDHQILTNSGFMFYEQVKAASKSDPHFRVAQYNDQTQQLEYVRPARVVYNAPRLQEMISIDNAGGVAALVTPEHEMYAQKQQSWTKAPASALMACDSALFQTQAKNGVAVPPSKRDRRFVDALGLSAQQVPAFLRLLGGWLCNGGFVLGGADAIGVAGDAELLRGALDELGVEQHLVAVGSNARPARCVAERRYVEFFRAECGLGAAVAWLPSWVFGLERSEMRALIEGMSGGANMSVTTMSAEFCEQLEHLMVLAGYSVATRIHQGGAREVCFADEASAAIQTKSEVTRVSYSSYTWCVTVPSGLIVTRRAAKSADGSIAKTSRPLVIGNCPYSVLVTQILETEAVTSKLLHYTLAPGETRDFRVRQGLGIVIQVLNLLHKETDNFEFEEGGGAESEDPQDKEPPYFVQQFTARLPEFVEVLKAPSGLPPHKNAGVAIPNPFGFTRLRVLEFVVGLIGTGFPVVVARLEELDVFSVCVKIFFENPWNNFAHHQVYLLLSRILSTSTDFATVERVLRRSHFVELTLEAFAKNDSRTAGYFGHAVELCNEVLNCAAMSPEVAAVLDANPEWAGFVEQKLEPVNAISNAGPVGGFGGEDEEEDEEDFSYDPEQYYYGMPGPEEPGEDGGEGGGAGGGEYAPVGDGEGGDDDGGQFRAAQAMLDVDAAMTEDQLLDMEIEQDLKNLSIEPSPEAEGEREAGGDGEGATNNDEFS